MPTPASPRTASTAPTRLRVDDGKPAIDFNEDTAIDATDLFTRLSQSGIAGEVSIALESVRDPAAGDGGADGLDPLGRRGFCVVGVEVLKRCVVPGSVVRTWWQRTADDGAER